MEKFHLARQNDAPEKATFLLEKALQTTEYRPEALIWKGIEAMQKQQLNHAFLFFNDAAHALPQRADVKALLGRSVLALQQPKLATAVLSSAWKQMPTDPGLRIMLWQARSQTEPADKLRRLILAHMPEIQDPQELQLVLRLLAAQRDGVPAVGVARYEPETQEVSGWAVDLRTPSSVISVHVESGEQRIECRCDQKQDLLAQVGLSANHGAFRIRLKDPAQTLHVRFADGTPLLGSPLSNLPPFTPPLPVGKHAGRQEPVDVLVPVYDGYDETLECIDSVLRSRSFNRTAHRLVVLDDATPNQALRQALQALAAAGHIEHVQHAANLGFIRNVNRGMALSPERDVVWLNADTRVHGNWLDRLRTVAYGAKDIASVTPFTNNGELMSFPESRVSHTMPTAPEQAELDLLAQETNSPAVEIETGCGFCLYIKRSAINQVGYLDEVHLLRGYGEETDWCLRARSLGWRHMGAPGVFVAHQGGISFGDEKVLRVAHNNAILRRRYPDASERYDRFCRRDPIKPARQALQRARLNQLATTIAQTHPRLWPEKTLKQLHISGINDDAPLSLNWRCLGGQSVVTLNAKLLPLPFSLEYQLPADRERLLSDLRDMPVQELVYQQLSGCPEELLGLAAYLDKPYRIICQDDELLEKQSGYDWASFAKRAQHVHLPWKALQKRYTEALQIATIAPELKRKTLPTTGPAPSTVLIADVLDETGIANQWITLARRITREKLPLLLLTHGNSAWQQNLLATGAVHALPEVQGLNLADTILLAGCKAALSLNADPGASWGAPALCAALGLPLYAVPGDVANEAGALPMDQLLSPSRA